MGNSFLCSFGLRAARALEDAGLKREHAEAAA